MLLLLFDVYLTWARIEKQSIPEHSTTGESSLGKLSQQPIVLQYLFFRTLIYSPSPSAPPSPSLSPHTYGLHDSRTSLFLARDFPLTNPPVVLCFLSTTAFHLSIRFLTSSYLSPFSLLSILPAYPRPNSVSTALLVSSSTKLFPILMVIWEYDVPAAARSLGWAVVANNVEALRILLDCKYYVACLLAVAGASARWMVGRTVLGLAGLGDVDSMSENSVAADGKALWALLMYVREWAGRLAVG